MPPSVEPAWRRYQKQVGDLLTQLGFVAAIDERVDGVRGSHQIDVTARLMVAGINQLWVVECKLWKDPVRKKDVLTFTAIVADVGADRGLFFSESGFQAGAIRATHGTNLSLTSFAGFKENIADKLAPLRMRGLDKRAADLIHEMEAAWHSSGSIEEEVRRRYVGPNDLLGRPDVVATTSVLSMLRGSLESAQYGKWPVPFTPLDHDDHDGVMTVSHLEGLLLVAEELVSTCEHIYSYMMNGGDPVASWKEFQSTEMTELLEQVRSRSTDPERLQ